MAAPIHQAIERLVQTAAESTPAGDAMLRALRDSLIAPQTPQECAALASRLVRQQMPLSVGEILCQRFAEDASGLTLIPALEALEAVLSVLSDGRAASNSDALQRGLRQQLQDSGYLRILPQLLDTAANLPATPLPAAGSSEAEACRQRMRLAELLLSNHRFMMCCWPRSSMVRTKPAVRAAALATAVLGFVDAAVWRQQPEQFAAAQHMLEAALSLQLAATIAVVCTVVAMLQTVWASTTSCEEPELCSLILRYKKPMMLALALLFCKQVDADSSSSSGGSTGSSSSSMRAHQQHEGSDESKCRCSYCCRKAAAEMPKVYSAYVDSLSLAVAGMLFASRVLTDSFSMEFCGLAGAYVVMVESLLRNGRSSRTVEDLFHRSSSSSSSSSGAHSDSSKRASFLADLSQHSLLIPALLHYTVTSPCPAGTAVEVQGACVAAYTAITYAVWLGSHIDPATPGELEWRLPLDVVEAAVQSLTELLTRLQQLPSSCGSSGSASSAGGSSSACDLPQAVTALGTCVLGVSRAGAPLLVELETNGSASTSNGAASEADIAAWVPHAAQMCVLLEACVRTVAAAAAAAGSQRMPVDHWKLLSRLWTDDPVDSDSGTSSTGGPLFNALLSHADLGVKEERQMYALAVTLVKASAVLQQQEGFDMRAARVHALAMTVATSMVQRHMQLSSKGPENPGPENLSRVEPWVQLVSRGLLLEPMKLLVAEEQQQPGQQATLAELVTGFTWFSEMLRLGSATMGGVVACLEWLKLPGAAACVAARECNADALLTRVKAAAAAATEVPIGQLSSPTVIRRYVVSFFERCLPQHEAAVAALLPVAHSWACNNPACLELSKSSELQLVGGKSCVCGGCRVARFCSRACLRQHWQLHKPVCKALAAAAAAQQPQEQVA